MVAIPFSKPRAWGVLALVVACGSVCPTSGAEPEKKEKTVPFALKKATWDKAIDAYAKASSLKADVKVKPAGTITIDPAGGRKLTVGEITDLLNETLLRQKLCLIRSARSFSIIKPGAKIDPTFVTAIDLKNRSTRGRTELVEVAIPLDPLVMSAEEASDELKKMLTPFGEVLVAKGRWIIFRDTVENVRRIHEAVTAFSNETK